MNRANRNIAWIESNCRVPEGTNVGQPIVLRSWQKKIIRSIYGTPTRQAIISVARKNGKTGLSAMLLLLHLVGPESLPNSQLYSAAQSRDQAAITFNLAAKMVRMSPDLSRYVIVRDTAKQLACAELGTLYRALSAEASTAYGLSPVFVIHDELGQVTGPRSELYEALETASGAHQAPLSIVISTQAPDDGDLLSILIDDAQAANDPNIKLILYTAPLTDDPWAVATIKKANPAYGDFLNASEARATAAKAKRMPSAEASYRNLILNQRIQMHNPFVSRSVWESCATAPSAEAIHSMPCYIGLDLSARHDLTALAMVGFDGEKWNVFMEFFAPEQGVFDRARRDRAPYDVWAQQGHLTLTPGASIEYAYIAERLIALCDDYRVQTIAFDRWRMDVLKSELNRMNCKELPLVDHGQGYKDMSPALDALESELLNSRIAHGGHPILRWCAANAVVTQDPAGNRKLDKVKASGRIDGMIALAMAIGRAAQHIPQAAVESVYEHRGVLTL